LEKAAQQARFVEEGPFAVAQSGRLSTR
jgi:hypothetical protein